MANTSKDPIQCNNNTKNNTKVVQSNLTQEDIFLDKNNKSDGLVLKVRVVEKESNTPVLGAKIKVTNISTNNELTSFSMKSPVTFIRGINKSQYKVELVTIQNGYKALLDVPNEHTNVIYFSSFGSNSISYLPGTT